VGGGALGRHRRRAARTGGLIGPSPGRPLVVAHRGASDDWPEHTRAAVRAAVLDGADGIECDVRLSSDGVPVCVHDATVDRTSDGKGRVTDLPLARLRALDWGSWHPAVAAGRAAPGDPHGLLTLSDLVAELLAAPRPVGLFVETKHPAARGTDVEAAVVEVVRPALGRLPVVAGMSFWPPAIGRFRELAADGAGRAPGLLRVRLRSARWHLPAGRAPEALGLDIALLRHRPGLAAVARRRGQRVFVWTVDRPEDVRLCRDLGVDGIITNRPRATRDILRA
jgi:glycerophosphoryl diester phosphodiesterase